MNFQQLRRALPHLDELRLCAGSARADGALVSAMALLRQGARAVLCAVERVEEGSLEQPSLPRRATNRARILARCDSEAYGETHCKAHGEADTSPDACAYTGADACSYA